MRVPLGPKSADKGSAAEPPSDVTRSCRTPPCPLIQPIPPASHAILGWREGLGRDTREGNQGHHVKLRGGRDERSDPANEKCRAWREQRGISEPPRVHPQSPRQSQPERLGLYRRRRRDRNHHAPQPHGARRDRVPPARAAQCRQGRRLGRTLRPQATPAGDAGAGRRARDLRSRCCRKRGARGRPVWRGAYAQFSLRAGPREGR